MDPGTVGEERTPERVEVRQAIEREEMTTVAVTTSAIGGQPAMFTTGLFLMTSATPTAPVGLGRAACTLPQWAQAPTARIAAAPVPPPPGYPSRSALPRCSRSHHR